MLSLLRLGAVVTTVLQQGDVPGSWTEPVAPFEIADDLYYVGTAELTSFLFVSDDGHILIDAPMQQNVGLLLRNIRALGFDPADIEVQLASHAHFDHVGGLAGVLEATGAALLLSAADAALVGSGGGPREAGGGYPAAAATRRIQHLERVQVGGRTLQAHLTPGHTRGCTTWSGAVEIDGRPLTFVSVCSLTVLPGYRLAEPDPSYAGMAADFCSSVAHLRALQPDIFLASHGSFFGLAEKAAARRAGDRFAFVDPKMYHRYLDRALQSIERALVTQGQKGGCAEVVDRESRVATPAWVGSIVHVR